MISMNGLPTSKRIATYVLLIGAAVAHHLGTNVLLAGTLRPAEEQPLALVEIVATKALNGEFGELAEWQRVGYTRLLENGTRRRTAWITNYATGEPGVGTITASGRRVELGRTAAMRNVPWGTYVLLELPHGCELRQVWDTGSSRNVPRARSRGAQTWVDRYIKHNRRELNMSWIAPVHVENWST